MDEGKKQYGQKLTDDFFKSVKKFEQEVIVLGKMATKIRGDRTDEKIILKSGRERSLLNRHPWVFSGGVKQMPKAPNGSIVEVRSNADELLGYGFFAPNSQIMCRLFEFTSEPMVIDENYWKEKITRAFNYRKLFINPETTNIYRLIHAEGDFFPGIIIDIYNQAAVCQILVKGVELISQTIFDALQS